MFKPNQIDGQDYFEQDWGMGNTCQNCKFWTRNIPIVPGGKMDAKEYYGEEKYLLLTKWGFCSNEVAINQVGATDEDGENYLIPDENFGCVNHQP